MMKRRFVNTAMTWLLTGALVSASFLLLAVDQTDAQTALIGTCVACHGADGIGKAQQYPNLAGQKAAYLEKQLKAFRSGERKDSNMEPLAQPLSDEDIAAVSAYFANLN